MINKKDLSPFGVAAVSLDFDFSELERLGGQLERLEIETENGLEHSLKVLNKFGECGTNLANHLETMAQELVQARVRAENISQLVSAKAQLIQKRHTETQVLLAQFQKLVEEVRTISESVAKISKTDAQSIDFLDQDLENLFNQACSLRNEAHLLQMKTLEKNTHSLSQTLQSARGKLKALGSHLNLTPQTSDLIN